MAVARQTRSCWEKATMPPVWLVRVGWAWAVTVTISVGSGACVRFSV